MKTSVDFLIMSDIHLSSAVSRSDKAVEILDKYEPKTLIINGDMIDSEHLKRLKKDDWKFLSKLRKLTKRHTVIVAKGNHDGGILDLLGDLLDLDIVESVDIQVSGKTYHVVHGDCFDRWTSDWPVLSEMASTLHYLFQKLGGRRQRFALFLKHTTKRFLRCTDEVKELAFNFCKKNNYTGLIAGHTHFAENESNGDIEYWNSGCFAEADGKNSYIVIHHTGKIELKWC